MYNTSMIATLPPFVSTESVHPDDVNDIINYLGNVQSTIYDLQREVTTLSTNLVELQRRFETFIVSVYDEYTIAANAIQRSASLGHVNVGVLVDGLKSFVNDMNRTMYDVNLTPLTPRYTSTKILDEIYKMASEWLKTSSDIFTFYVEGQQVLDTLVTFPIHRDVNSERLSQCQFVNDYFQYLDDVNDIIECAMKLDETADQAFSLLVSLLETNLKIYDQVLKKLFGMGDSTTAHNRLLEVLSRNLFEAARVSPYSEEMENIILALVRTPEGLVFYDGLVGYKRGKLREKYKKLDHYLKLKRPDEGGK